MMPLGARCVAILLALVISVGMAVDVSAQLYEWVDEKGQHNFTDNPNNVPEKYRPKATQSPGLRATPETLRRDAERRRREQLESAAESRQRGFTKTADECAGLSEVEIFTSPGGRVEYLGTEQARFDFRKCMNASGRPLK